LQETELDYRILMEQSADGIFISDAQGNYIDVNLAACDMLGYSREELVGLHITDIIAEEEIPRLAGEVGKFSSGKIVNSVWLFKRKDGSLFTGELIGRSLPDGRLQGILRDITERKKAEVKIMKANRLYALISQVNQSIVQIRDEQQLLDKVCDIAIEFGKFRVAWLGMVDEQRKINLVSLSGDSIFAKRILRLNGISIDDPMIKVTPTGKVLQSGKYDFNNDIENDSMLDCNWKEELISHGVYASISLPIFRSGKISGIFGLHASSKDFFDEAEIKLLEEAAGDISFALDNFDKEKQRQLIEAKLLKSEERLNQAQRVAHIGSWELDLLTRTSLWSAELCEIFGLEPEDNRQSTKLFLSYIHPDDLDFVSKAVAESNADFSACSIEHRIIRKDGAVRYVQTERRFEFDAEGRPQYLHGIVYDLTEKKEAEKQVSDNFAMFRGFFESAPEAVFIGDCDSGKFIDCNDNAISLFGYTHEELLEKNPGMLSPEFQPDGTNSAEGSGQMVMRAMGGEKVIFEWVHLNAAGKAIDCEVRLTRLDISGRNLVRGSVIDISEKKQAEIKLKRANRLYAFISAVNQSIVHIKDQKQLLDKICNIALDIGGFKMAWIGLLDANKYLQMASVNGYPQGIKRVMKHSGTHMDDPIVKNTLTGRVLKTGKYLYCNDMQTEPAYALWRDEFISQGLLGSIAMPIMRSGEVMGVFSLQTGAKNFFDTSEIALLEEAASDISFALDNFEKESKRQQAEDKLIHSEAKLKQAQTIAHVGSWEMDMAEGIVIWSDEACHIFGVSTADNKQSLKAFLKLVHPDDIGFVSKIIDESNATHTDSSIDHRIVRSDGTVRYLHTARRFEFDNEGRAIRLYGIIHDVSDKKLTEAQREFDKNNLDALINNTGDYMWSVDRDYKLITYNKPLREIIKTVTGKTLEKGTNMLSYAFSQEQAVVYRDFYERAFAGEAFTEIEHIQSPFESWTEISFYPIREGDKIIGSACHSRSITERKQAENLIKELNENLEKKVLERTAELTNANKALEAFSYSVSHDLRAPVRSMMGFAKILEEYHFTRADDEAKELFKFLNENGRRANTIIDDLLKFAKYDRITLAKEQVDMRQMIEGVWSNMSRTNPHHAALTLSDLPIMNADRSMIEQVIINLMSNAIKYSSKKEKPQISIWSEQSDNGGTLYIKDNGAGFDMESSDKLFGAFQRLHSMSDFEGTGVGLALIKKIIEKHGGTVGAEGKVDEGATFYFTLPVDSRG